MRPVASFYTSALSSDIPLITRDEVIKFWKVKVKGQGWLGEGCALLSPSSYNSSNTIAFTDSAITGLVINQRESRSDANK